MSGNKKRAGAAGVQIQNTVCGFVVSQVDESVGLGGDGSVQEGGMRGVDAGVVEITTQDSTGFRGLRVGHKTAGHPVDGIPIGVQAVAIAFHFLFRPGDRIVGRNAGTTVRVCYGHDDETQLGGIFGELRPFHTVQIAAAFHKGDEVHDTGDGFQFCGVYGGDDEQDRFVPPRTEEGFRGVDGERRGQVGPAVDRFKFTIANGMDRPAARTPGDFRYAADFQGLEDIADFFVVGQIAFRCAHPAYLLCDCSLDRDLDRDGIKLSGSK